MRRKNRKWVAIAVGLYLFVMWSAYHWSAGQKIPEGNIFVRIEREGVRRLQEQQAKAAQQPPQPTGEIRLSAAGPAYVAARYDATHVVFVVATDTEARFPNSPFSRGFGMPTRVPASLKPSAPLAGLQELWEPDSHSLHFFPAIVQKTQPGEQWWLNVSPTSTIPVVIDRVIVAPTGCSLALGFLASVSAEQQAAFAKSSREYFVVRHDAVESSKPPVAPNLTEIPNWQPLPAYAQEIERQLNERMMQEGKAIDARLLANASSPGATAAELPVGDARPRLKEWIHADRGLALGRGVLDYDLRAFRITPDGVPRLFVRARWKLAEAPVFLMTAWFKAAAQPVLLSADANWSAAMRNGDAPVSLGDQLAFQSILNEFDADHDGWAELLVHSDDGTSTAIAPYLYTDRGLVPMKSALRHDTKSPASCLDP
jgi:hypothetical protein